MELNKVYDRMATISDRLKKLEIGMKQVKILSLIVLAVVITIHIILPIIDLVMGW